MKYKHILYLIGLGLLIYWFLEIGEKMVKKGANNADMSIYWVCFIYLISSIIILLGLLDESVGKAFFDTTEWINKKIFTPIGKVLNKKIIDK